MHTVYFALLDESGFVKTVEHQEASDIQHLQIPNDCVEISAEVYHVLNDNIGDGRKYRIRDGDVITVQNLSSIKTNYRMLTMQKVIEFKNRGVLINGHSYRLDNDTMTLVSLFANNDNGSYHLVDALGDPVEVIQEQVNDLKKKMACVMSKLIQLERVTIEQIELCRDIPQVESTYETFEEALANL